jgi:hypothetical protein
MVMKMLPSNRGIFGFRVFGPRGQGSSDMLACNEFVQVLELLKLPRRHFRAQQLLELPMGFVTNLLESVR